MSLINLNDVKHRQVNRRRADGRLNSMNPTPHFQTREYLPPTVKRQSTCEIEVDAWASDIKNKEAIEQGLDVNPGLAAIWAEEKARRILAGLKGGDSQLGPPSSPPRSNLEPTDNDLLQLQRFQRKLVFVSQSEESSVSRNSNSSYPLEVDDEFNLLDASHLERHIGPQNENRNQKNESREEIKPDFTLVASSEENISLHLDNKKSENIYEKRRPVFNFETLKSSGEEVSSPNQYRTLDHSTFEAEDISLVDILEKLAEGHKTDELVEDDSILGSHCSAVVSEYKSDEEDEDGISDLNLTTFEIDSLNLNSELTPVCSGRSASVASDQEKSGTSFAIKSLSIEDSDDQKTIQSQKSSQNSVTIPQLDGADDLPSKRSSVERSASRKRRKVVDDLKKDKVKKDNDEKEEFIISGSSTSGTLEPNLDRTLVSEEKGVTAFKNKSTISETSESADDLSENARLDYTLVVEEKLICDYKSSKEARSTKKEMLVNRQDNSGIERSIFLKDEERRLKSSSRLLESPKRDLRSSTCDLRSPSRTSKTPNSSARTPNKALRSPRRGLKSPSYALRSPGRPLRSPRRLLGSPRRNYASLNITVTPSKRQTEPDTQKMDIISEDDESSGDVASKEMSIFTQKPTTSRSSEDAICEREYIKRLILSNKALGKRSKEVCEDVSPQRKLIFSQKSKTEENCKNVETPGKLLLPTKSQTRTKSERQKTQVRKRSEVELSQDATPSRKLVFSQRSRNARSSEDEVFEDAQNNERLLLSQKSIVKKNFEVESSKETFHEIPLAQKSGPETNSEDDEIQGKLFFSQISQMTASSEDKFSKDTQNKEKFILSQKSTFEKSLEDEEATNEIFHEISLTQKSAPEKNFEAELNCLSHKKSFEPNSKKSKLIEDIDNVSSQSKNNKVYDEETDSSDFEGNLEVLLKDLNSNSRSSKVLSESGKLFKEMNQEEEHLAREENSESEKMKVPDLDITEEINNEVCNTEDLLTLTFTEFTKIQLNASPKLTSKSMSGLKSNRLVALTTKFCAPTRQHIVKSMDLYGIPTCRNQEPFYSDHNDIRTHKDTAHQIINKNQVSEFPQFKSEIGGVVGIKLWRRMKVNEFHSSGAKLNSVNVKRGLAERRLITITPLHEPPNRKMIVKWLKARKHLKRKEEEKVQKEKKCEEEIKDRKENKGESSNPVDGAKLNPLGSNETSEVLVDSGRKPRESLSNDSSLCSTLRPSELLISEKKKKKLGGISLGQADFSMDETKTQNDVANQNLQNAKAITTVSLICIFKNYYLLIECL